MTTRQTQTRLAALARGFRATAPTQEKLGIEGLASKASLAGANVLVRLDLNVPLSKDDGAPHAPRRTARRALTVAC